LVKSFLCFLIATFVCNVVQRLIFAESWGQLIINGLISVVVYMVIVYFLILTIDERKTIITIHG
jgi:hypothetical protein